MISDTWRQQRVHLVAERDAPARRQAQRVGSVGVGEVVHVGPIRRRGARRRLAFEEACEDAGLPRARRPRRKDVIAFAGDVQAELDGARRALLADDAVEIRRVRGRGIREAGHIGATAQLFGGQFTGLGHEALLARNRRVFTQATIQRMRMSRNADTQTGQGFCKVVLCHPSRLGLVFLPVIRVCIRTVVW